MPSNSDHPNGEDVFDDDPYMPLSVEKLNSLIPGYEFVQFIDRGGMGAVYKAVQKSLNRMVAVKILPPVHRNKQRFAERFAREARALALLNHPHIVSVYDSGETRDGHMFYAMEFVTGTDLSHLLRRESLSPRQILTIVTQVCEALQFAHEHGVVHRDIKPANILIDERGNVKVADFGLAKVSGHGTGASSYTATGTAMGTPHYIAPEAMTHEADADHRADIYSLGVMIYEMLTGQVPKGVWELPSKRSGADASLDEIVTTAMQNAPNKRYQQVSDMTLIIQKLLEHGERLAGFDTPRAIPERKPAGPSAEFTTMRLGDPKSQTKKHGVIAFVGIAAVLAAGVLAAKRQPIADTPQPPTSPTITLTATQAQTALANWVFDKGGFINVAKPGSADRVMGDAADLYSAIELPKDAFTVWRVNVTRNPLPNDAAFNELVDLCLKAGTVENLNLRNSSVKPMSLQRLQELDLLTNIDLTGSTAITEASVLHIAGCKKLTLFRLGGATTADTTRIATTLRSLRPDCEVVVE